MKMIFPALAAVLILAGCNKSDGDTEQLTFVCSRGGSGNYQMIYTNPETGRLEYNGKKELSIALKPGKTIKVTAHDVDVPGAINLTLMVNGTKVKEDNQYKAVIEYTNVQ